MNKITLKEFKSLLINNKSALLGSKFNTTVEAMTELIDKQIENIRPNINYNRIARSNNNSNIIKSSFTRDGKAVESRLDLNGKVFKHNDIYYIYKTLPLYHSFDNCILMYAIENN